MLHSDTAHRNCPEHRVSSGGPVGAVAAGHNTGCGLLSSKGRWLSDEKGEPVTAATHLKGKSQGISSEIFSRNMQRLSEYLTAVSTGK